VNRNSARHAESRWRESVLNKHTGAVLGLAFGIIAGSLLLNVAGAGAERSKELRAAQQVDALSASSVRFAR
jgi:hypothetical protein